MKIKIVTSSFEQPVFLMHGSHVFCTTIDLISNAYKRSRLTSSLKASASTKTGSLLDSLRINTLQKNNKITKQNWKYSINVYIGLRTWHCGWCTYYVFWSRWVFLLLCYPKCILLLFPYIYPLHNAYIAHLHTRLPSAILGVKTCTKRKYTYYTQTCVPFWLVYTFFDPKMTFRFFTKQTNPFRYYNFKKGGLSGNLFDKTWLWHNFVSLQTPQGHWIDSYLQSYQISESIKGPCLYAFKRNIYCYPVT